MKVAEKKSFAVEKKRVFSMGAWSKIRKSDFEKSTIFFGSTFTLIYLSAGQTTCKCFLLYSRTLKVSKKKCSRRTNWGQFFIHMNCLQVELLLWLHCQGFCGMKFSQSFFLLPLSAQRTRYGVTSNLRRLEAFHILLSRMTFLLKAIKRWRARMWKQLHFLEI